MTHTALELAYDMSGASEALVGIVARVTEESIKEKADTGTGWLDIEKLSATDQRELGRFSFEGASKPYAVGAGVTKESEDWEMDMVTLIEEWLEGEGVTMVAGNAPEGSLTSDLAVYLCHKWPPRD